MPTPCVNALNRAYPISTLCQYERSSRWMVCVNALGRAYPISTVSLPKPFKINGFRVRFQGVIVRKFWQFGFFEQKRACLQFVHIYACFYSTTHPAKTQAKFQNVLTCHCDSAVRPNSSEKNPPDDRKRLPANHIFTGSPCGMRDLNPHALRHKNLNLACLPIPSIPLTFLSYHLSSQKSIIGKIYSSIPGAA